MNRVILFFALALSSLTVGAEANFSTLTHYRYLCNCAVANEPYPTYGTTPVRPVTAQESVTNFINNNVTLVSQGRGRFGQGDIVTVCDGKLCETVIYDAAAGVWLPLMSTFADNGKGYRNSKLTLKSGVVGGATAQFSYLYSYIDYTATQPYERKGIVIVGPITPVATLDGGSIGGRDFNMAFDWGTATNSDAAATGQGGTVICSYAGCKNLPGF